MNLLDWSLVLVTLAYALSGYWQGFITGAFATAGLIVGGLFGIWVAPHVLGNVEPALWVSLAALFVVLVCASFGQAFAQYAGAKVRDKITWQPIRAVDAVGGGALSVIAVLTVTWMLGVAVSGSQIPGVGQLVRESTVLTRVNEVMPTQAQGLLRGFDKVVGSSFFPRYLEPFAPERIVPVEPPLPADVDNADVQRARASVFKVRGNNSCGDGVEGSGFLFGRGLLMTNAHVVAGVSKPVVLSASGEHPARVVWYDPDTDVAVLSVPDLRDSATIKFDDSGKAADRAVVLGFPNDGPFNAQSARIRSDAQLLKSPDIYGRGTVTREVFSIRSLVRPGNSGGPLVSLGGKVFGVIFAASVSDKQTGYALTADQVSDAVSRAKADGPTVSSGNCT
ncbi:MAG: MarP family serine protease [Propionibacteriales bacterium]|nr:MarP family serine protease [Propionibacteriales bacterium]